MARPAPGWLAACRHFDAWAWYAFALGFALPVSTALVSILAAGTLVWAASHPRDCLAAWRDRLREPIFIAMLALLGIILAGVPIALANGYSPWRILLKHANLLPFFLLIGLFRATPPRTALLLGFALAMTLSLILSLFAAASGLHFMNAGSGDYPIFLNHTEHNIFLALTGFAAASLAIRQPANRLSTRITWALVALAVFDIAFLVLGRTGHIVLALLTVLFVTTCLRGRSLVIALIMLTGVLGITVSLDQSAIRRGIGLASQDIVDYQRGNIETSLGLRLTMQENAWTLIDARPILGYGTGGYAPAYRELSESAALKTSITTNPHNDYLFYWVEHGLFGLLAVVGLYLAIAWTAYRRGTLGGIWLGGLAIAWAVPSLGNSVLLDHTSGFVFSCLLAALLTSPTSPSHPSPPQR